MLNVNVCFYHTRMWHDKNKVNAAYRKVLITELNHSVFVNELSGFGFKIRSNLFQLIQFSRSSAVKQIHCRSVKPMRDISRNFHDEG